MLLPTPSAFITTTLAVLSVSIPEPTPAPHFDLVKREQSCGDLQGKYPNAKAPSCTGTFSLCIFSGALQGCCDNNGNCNFVTACVEAFATQSCTGASCLRCAASVPYCTRYEFDNGRGGGYNAYACGALDLSGTVVYGVVGTQTPFTSSSSSRSSSSSSSSSSQSTTGTTTTSGHTPTATNDPDSDPQPKRRLWPIAIAVIGGIAIVAGAGWWWFRKHQRDNRNYELTQPLVLQQ